MLTPEEIKRRMQETLSPGLLKLIGIVGEEAKQMHVKVYLVGGFVRDLIMGRPNFDVDFVVEGDAIRFVRKLKQALGGDIFVFPEFGTAKWMLTEEDRLRLGIPAERQVEIADQVVRDVDFATARSETYPRPGDLPIVNPTPVSIVDDLRRRDFTINAMAIRLPDRQLVDDLGGERDIADQSIRVLHDQSFRDDPTRIFRAVRFEQRFHFHIDPHTESLIAPALPIITRVSGERLRNELDLIFREAAPEKALIRLDKFGVLAAIDPELLADQWLCSAFQALRTVLPERAIPSRIFGPQVYWPIFAYRVEHLERLLARLPIERRIITSIEQAKRAVEVEKASDSLSASQFTRRIEPFDDLYVQCAALAITSIGNISHPHLKNYIERWRAVQPTLTGNDLIAMGLQPGPLFGKLLRQLRDDLLDGKITHEQERARVLELMAQGLSE